MSSGPSPTLRPASCARADGCLLCSTLLKRDLVLRIPAFWKTQSKLSRRRSQPGHQKPEGFSALHCAQPKLTPLSCSCALGEHAGAVELGERACLPSTDGEFRGLSVSGEGEPEEHAEGRSKEMVEVGVLLGPHGLQGDIKVKVLTDFPEHRFGKAGWKWVRLPGFSRRTERLWCSHGRLGPGKGAPWLVRIKGVNSADEALRLQGAVVLVEAGDRPELREGEVYSADLLGLKVFLLDGDVLVGVVDDVYSTGGAGELLSVRLDASFISQHLSRNKEQEGSTASVAREDAEGAGDPGTVQQKADTGKGQAETRRDQQKRRKQLRKDQSVWIPFVREIVPVLDVENGLVKISPPAGLLELKVNTASNGTPKSKKGKAKTKVKKEV